MHSHRHVSHVHLHHNDMNTSHSTCSVKQQMKYQSSILSFFYEGYPPLCGGFPSQRASISLSWHHYALHFIAPHIPASLACLGSIFTPRVATAVIIAAVNVWHTVFNTVFLSITAKVSGHYSIMLQMNMYVYFCKRKLLWKYLCVFFTGTSLLLWYFKTHTKQILYFDDF